MTEGMDMNKLNVAFIGFGEAGLAIARDLTAASISAFDIQTW